ncbi:MAG: amidoligase family protein [Zhenhengia sp.]|uniref:amidoligase family protein n=1 Tax=Zhenhengia sp. TaxID=2944208 RepID=UPI003993BE08
MDYHDLRFGIEIECTGATRFTVAKTIAQFFGTGLENVNRTLDNYDTYEIKDPQHRTWKVMRDASILTQQIQGNTRVSADASYSIEIVSPILRYDDIVSLQEMIRVIRKVGAFVNSSCGIHIHVSADAFDAKHLRFLCNIVYSKQNLIYKALGVKQLRSRYCKKLDEKFIDKLYQKKPTSLFNMAEIWYAQASDDDWQRRYNESRYHILNLHPLLSGRQQSIEYRCFNGTLHAGEIKSYIQFSLLLTASALNAKSASRKVTVPVTENDKYAFRVWLLKLGMIGDEFKTARLHLLKNLTGNIAWRDRLS